VAEIFSEEILREVRQKGSYALSNLEGVSQQFLTMDIHFDAASNVRGPYLNHKSTTDPICGRPHSCPRRVLKKDWPEGFASECATREIIGPSRSTAGAGRDALPRDPRERPMVMAGVPASDGRPKVRPLLEIQLFYARLSPPRFQRLILALTYSWAYQPRLHSFCAFDALTVLDIRVRSRFPRSSAACSSAASTGLLT
jgi:hypothetical protein